ncbi:MAG: FAD-dependent oxidoreductase [Armatimonadota bacterium]
MPEYDCLIIGAGSGGIGAAIAAGRRGLRVLVVEKAPGIGGTAVRAGVHAWEPVAGATGIPFEIYRRLTAHENAVAITSLDRHLLWDDTQPPWPGSLKVPDPDRTYADTLQRHGARSMAQDEGFCRRVFHSVIFEPRPYVRVVEAMLDEAGCDVRCGTAFVSADVRDGHVCSVQLDDGSSISAHTYLDCSADAVVCEACGCEIMFGQQARGRFDEPHAPDNPGTRINGATLVYRVTPAQSPAIEPLPNGVPADCWWRDHFPSAAFNQYPCTDLNINMLPTLSGEELSSLGYEAGMAEARRRIRAHWHDLQTRYELFRRYRMRWIAPELGVREGPRVVTEYVLNENDLLAGLSGQCHNDIIAIADHAMDTHGSGGGCEELAEPYGVPYRCLLPEGFDNLLVACRGAGFSSIAASSCRLSRTMMQLGQAAGIAAAIATERSIPASNISTDTLRGQLHRHQVQLEWPMAARLRAYLSSPAR